MLIRMELSSPVFEATRERLVARFGETVQAWWRNLPEVLESLESRWNIKIGKPVGRGNTSLVLRCLRDDGRSAILKLTPDAEIALGEATALRSWRSSGHVPEVWGHDQAQGALLLEAMPSEVPLAEARAGVDITEVAVLLRALHASGDPVVGRGVVSLADRVDFMFDQWARRYEQSPPIPAERVHRGHELAHDLAASADSPVLLHGDLHAYNVLEGGPGRGLVAIDPRPCVGDPAFDAVDWVIWPKNGAQNWKPRCQRLGEAMQVDPDRIWDWLRTFAAMLAATTIASGRMPNRAEAFLAIAP